jgi:asparagine synthase (glutamine-hydrolysing)
MAHSVEARLPFLDHRLVEYAFKLPPEWKMRGPWNKYILRQALSNVIPKSVSERMDKFGFPTPVGEWFRGNLKEAAMDVLTSNQFRQMGIFDVESVLKDFTNHVERKIDIGPRLFSVIQYYIWKQKHLR